MTRAEMAPPAMAERNWRQTQRGFSLVAFASFGLIIGSWLNDHLSWMLVIDGILLGSSASVIVAIAHLRVCSRIITRQMITIEQLSDVIHELQSEPGKG